MNRNKPPRGGIKFTQEQINILLGLLGSAGQEMGRKLNDATVEAEREFYGRQMDKFEKLGNLIGEHNPKRYDTSQDADPDEWVVGEDEDED